MAFRGGFMQNLVENGNGDSELLAEKDTVTYQEERSHHVQDTEPFGAKQGETRPRGFLHTGSRPRRDFSPRNPCGRSSTAGHR